MTVKIMREKLYFISSILLAATAIGVFGYEQAHQAASEPGYSRRGYDRTFVVEVVHDYDSSSGAGAEQLIGSVPNVGDGIQTVFSSGSAAKLRALPDVEYALPVSTGIRQVRLAAGHTAQVTTYNITPDFVHAFDLGDSAALRANEYVPSSVLRKQIGTNGSVQTMATLSVADSAIQELPRDMRNAIDWSKAKNPITLGAGEFGSGLSSTSFRDALFTTGVEAKISIPGLFLIPKSMVFIKLHADADIRQGLSRLREFLASASPAVKGTHFQVIPLSNFFEQQLGSDYRKQWAKRIQIGLFIVTALVFLMLALARHARIRHELVLRKALGVPSIWAVWFSSRGIVIAIMSGVSIPCLAALAYAGVAQQHHLERVVAALLTIYGVALSAQLAVIVLCLLIGKKDLSVQLKHA
jgi:hypothetical protein